MVFSHTEPLPDPNLQIFSQGGGEGEGVFSFKPDGCMESIKGSFQKFVYLTLGIICLCGPFARWKNVIQQPS